MKCLNERKKLITMIALLAILFFAVPVMAQSAQEGVFLEETMLKEGDSIYIDDILTYRKIVSLKEQIEDTVLPESLVMLEPGTVVSGTTQTVSGAVPIDGTTQFMVTIPCMVRQEAVQEDSVIIDGMKLFVTERPQGLLGTRSTLPLPSCTADLYKSEEDVKNKNPLTSGATINLADTFFIGITKENFKDITTDNTYTIELPEEFGVPKDSGSLDLYVAINSTNQKFGTLSWTSISKTLSIEFNDFSVSSGGGTIRLKDLINVTMGFACNLDKDKLVADENGKVTVRLPGDKTVDIIVPELKPQPPKIEKSVGTLLANGEVSWTITYTHPVTGYTGPKPAKLVDVIPEKLKYVVDTNTGIGSGKVYLNDNPISDSTHLTYLDGKLTYDIAGAALAGGDKVKITYQTALTEAAFSELWAEPNKTYTYENKAEGVDASGAAMTPPVSAAAKLEIPDNWAGRKVVDKTAVVSSAGDVRTITWTIEVLAHGQNFHELNVIDTMGKALTLDTTSVKVAADDSAPTSPTLATSTDGEGRTIMTVKLVKDGSPSPAADKYTITYKTDVKSEYFTDPGKFKAADISNGAALEYSWPHGVLPGRPAMPPAIGIIPRDDEVKNTLIEKTAGAYDYANNSIVWNMEINSSKAILTESVFEDDLSDPNEGHVFVLAGGDEAAAEATIEAAIKRALTDESLSESLLTSITLSNNKLRVELGNIGDTTLNFSITTYVANPESWAGNGNVTYHNQVIMKKDVTKIGGNAITENVDSRANKPVTSNVLKKENGKYLPEEKKIEWTFTVNEHAVNLGQVTITDVLSELLSCSPDDVSGATLNGGTFGGDNVFSFDSTNNTVTITLNNVNAKKEIKFKTSVDVDADIFRKQKDISISNQASMVSTANGNVVKSDQVDVTLVNQVIDKKGVKLDGPQSILSYTIQLNPLGMDLLKGQPAGTKLTISDKLPDGLYLDMESIKIYAATADSVAAVGGKYNVGLKQGTEIADAVIEYRAAENSFAIEIPDPAKSYIVKYNAYIVKAGVELVNDVQIMGSVLQGDKDHLSSQFSYKLSAFGSAGFSLPRDKFISLRIKKEDKDGNKLTGAEFSLYADKKGEQLLARGTTDNGTGICTLAIPKSAASDLEKLYWKETKAPDGYMLNDQWHEVKTASLPDTDIKVVNQKIADAALGKIKLRKTNQEGAALTGAAFTVYLEESCETVAAAEKNVDKSGEVTFDGLYPGRTYWIKETKVPQGYVQGDIVSVVASGDAAMPVTEIMNKKASGNLENTNTGGENEEDIENKEGKSYEKLAQEKVPANSTIPKTGVEDQIVWYALGFMVSLIAVAGLVFVIVRKKRS